MAEGLNKSPELLNQLRIKSTSNELPLALKDEIREQFVFRQMARDRNRCVVGTS